MTPGGPLHMFLALVAMVVIVSSILALILGAAYAIWVAFTKDPK